MTGGPHPAGCRQCRGTGRTPGPPIIEIVQGRRHEYSTVQPCGHDWWHDDTGWNPHYDEPLATTDPRAIAAAEAAVLGQDDLWELSGGKLGTPPNAAPHQHTLAEAEEWT